LPEARDARTRAEGGEAINAMLGMLDISHTHYYHQEDPRYYELLDVFSTFEGETRERIVQLFGEPIVSMPSIGVVTERIGGKDFVVEVLHGSAADRAGVLVGDRIVSAEGAPWDPISSLVGRVGAPIRVEIQRTPDPESREELWVDVERVVPHEAFERDLRESARVFEKDGARVAYVRVYSFAGEQFYLALKEAIAKAPLKDADALIIDIRAGWGGASPEYLHLVSRRAPRMSFRHRGGQWQDMGTGAERSDVEPAWTRPAVMLIDAGSRSGKEILAYGFKTYGVGPLVGERTSGAVVGGRLFPLSNGDGLYLAVMDVRVDGRRLEGVGVAPDVEVAFDRRYAGGKDPQIERAVEVAARIAFGGDPGE